MGFVVDGAIAPLIAMWTGLLKVNLAGNYSFSSTSDDGSAPTETQDCTQSLDGLYHVK